MVQVGGTQPPHVPENFDPNRLAPVYVSEAHESVPTWCMNKTIWKGARLPQDVILTCGVFPGFHSSEFSELPVSKHEPVHEYAPGALH